MSALSWMCIHRAVVVRNLDPATPYLSAQNFGPTLAKSGWRLS